MDLLLQLFGGFLLLAGLALGARIWIQPRAKDIDLHGQLLLLLVLLTLMGGLIGSPFWWLDERRSFSWRLPPLASRMLAAAGWSYVVAALFTLVRPTPERVKLLLVFLFVYLAPLAFLAPLLYSDRFDFHAFLPWAFFFIVGLMTLGSLYFLIRTPNLKTPAEPYKPSVVETAWLAKLAVGLGLWGVALVITDSGFSKLIWVWPGDRLTSALIGVMLLAISAGSAWTLLSRSPTRMLLAITATYGIGAAAANLWNELQNKPVKELYVVVFGLIGLVSLALLWLGNEGSASSAPDLEPKPASP